MHPQTLGIATWLLYLDGVFAILGFLDKSNEFGFLRVISPVTGLLGLVSCLCFFGSGFLMANGKLLGWYLGIAASFSPLLARLIISIHQQNLGYTISLVNRITGGDLIGFMFEAALVVLLLHPMSRSYARTWLR
ncbi:MAG: hypothetical protein JHC78_10775 [Ilumatobacteraceae bacterium]|jgi:hypothetical protein|nr:hypothetical protein [Ilumatobacteraceae bacterium]MBJ7368522.1 hypothetical protein [Ilumatobacteraceae bacterium]